jgi:hypothetical protein
MQNTIQPSFSGGEASPAIYPRVDIQKYYTMLRRCRNFFIHPQGGVSNRPGFRFVNETKDSTKLSRVIPFIFNADQTYILEFGDEYVRFYTDGARLSVNSASAWSGATAYVVGDYVTYNSATVYYAIQDGTNKQPDTQTAYWTPQTIYEEPSPYQEADLALLRFESSADVIYITHPDYQTRTLTRYGATDWRFALYAPEDGPFMPENVDESLSLNATAVTGTITLNATSSLFDADHVGALWKLRHYVEGQTISQAFSSATTSSGIKCFTTWRVISHGTWTGKFRVEKSTDGGTTWTVLRTFSSVNDFNANTSGTEDVETNTEPFLVRLNMYSYTSGTANIDLTTDAFYQDGIVEVITYNSATSVNATVLTELGLTTNTTSWAEGSWSDFRGWPAVCRFHQDRLCFAGTYGEPMTTWMSRLGNYVSFLRHSPLLDTDAITVNLPTRQLNAINGLVALKKLLAFTIASEWSIGAVDTALAPTTVRQDAEGYNGSNGIEAVTVDNEVIYAQKHGKTVGSIGYQLAQDSFTGSDLNILAKHLFEGYEIIEMAYQKEPYRLVWCLRDDGVLLSMTYMPDQEVVGWAWHDTDGTIESIAVIPSTEGFDELWIVVERENGRFIERMALRNTYSTCNE